MLRIKICGITSYEEASTAACLGADAVGFVFAQSPRQIRPTVVRRIIRRLPPIVQTVGVFVNEDPARIKEIKQYCGFDLIQLHGDENPDVCRGLMPCVIKAFAIKDEASLDRLKHYRGSARAFLLDACTREKRGGTGKTFDWKLAVEAKKEGVPVILSGGLKPDNIRKAVSVVQPYAVDVSSGVEERPGKKSMVLLKAFMKAAREKDAATG